MDAEEIKNLAEYRADVSDRETAHQLAANETMTIVKSILELLDEMNFGLAKELCRRLIDDGLPNDHGGPVTHYPLFEKNLEQAYARRKT